MIYFAQYENDNGPIKIGLSRNIQKRLAEIQMTCPAPIKLLKVIEGEWEKEARIHYHFSHIRLHGEWFKPEKELLDFIENPYEVPEIPKTTWSVNTMPIEGEVEKVISYSDSETKLYTVDEVAKLLKVNSSLIRRYCRQGRLGEYIYGRWLITPDELEEFKAKPRKRGNPDFGPNFNKKIG